MSYGYDISEGLSHILTTHSEVVIAGTDASQKLKIVRACQKIRKEEVQVHNCSAHVYPIQITAASLQFYR